MSTLPPNKYYDTMYDIEDLTGLNRDAGGGKSEVVVQAEQLIVSEKCKQATRMLRSVATTDVHAGMILQALWIKNILFGDIVAAYEEKSPKQCALEELQFYTNRSRESIEEDMLVEVPVARSWHAMNIDGDDPSSILQFYRETDGYVYELMAANHIVQTLYTYSQMVARMQRLGVLNVLDYGAGAGTLTILLKRLGYEVSYADLQSKTSNFARWRFQRRGMHVPMYELTGNERDDLSCTKLRDEHFDCIISTEVVEHVSRPLELLNSFYNKLPKGGVLVVSESCQYTEQFVSHLESNKKYGGHRFLEIMHDIGFEVQDFGEYIPQQLFIKL